MIVGFLIFLAAAIVVDGYIFWEYKFNSSFDDLSQVAVDGKVLVFKKQTLDRVIGAIDEKEKTLNDVFSTTTPPIKDPSLW